MAPSALLAILSVALVGSQRVRFSQGESWARQEPAAREHYWWKRAGNLQSSSSVPWMAPEHLSQGPSWNWSNPLGEQVRHSPLIDRDSNLYIATSTRIRKFSKHGNLLWTFESPTLIDGEAEMVTCPVLYGDAIVVALRDLKAPRTVLYSLSLATGSVNWRRERASGIMGDGNAALAYNDTFVFAATDDSRAPGGVPDGFNRQVVAVSAADGKDLWHFAVDGVVWNFVPASPGDGTLLFATSCGVPYKLDFGGKLLWKGAGEDPNKQCGAGGGALSPDGSTFFYSWNQMLVPGTHFDAVKVEDGSLLWSKTVYFGGVPSTAQYPAVGKLGPDGPLAVVGAVGDQPLLPDMDPRGDNRVLVNAVVALDAATGHQLWLSEEAPWPHTVAAGDQKSAIEGRLWTPRVTPACWPDSQGIPVIAGDGTVYASSSHHGDLRAIRHMSQEGSARVTEEVSTFHPDMAFLNSPSVAPGMLVAAPCWGPAYVFLADEAHNLTVAGAEELTEIRFVLLFCLYITMAVMVVTGGMVVLRHKFGQVTPESVEYKFLVA